MKKSVNIGAILGLVVLALLLVAGSAAAAPPQQMGGPGGPKPGPPPGGMWGPYGVTPGPWGTAELEEEEDPTGTYVRIDFEVSGHKAHRGLYEIRYPDGAVLASWYAYEGATDSGWIGDLELPKKTVWVDVVYVPGPGAAPVKLHILNPAPDTEYGWVSQGMNHAIEVAWPHMPVKPVDAMPLRPDGMPWGPEGRVMGPGPMQMGPNPMGAGPYGMPGRPPGMPGG